MRVVHDTLFKISEEEIRVYRCNIPKAFKKLHDIPAKRTDPYRTRSSYVPIDTRIKFVFSKILNISLNYETFDRSATIVEQ